MDRLRLGKEYIINLPEKPEWIQSGFSCLEEVNENKEPK